MTSKLKVEFVDNSASQYDENAVRIKLGLGKNSGKLYLGDRHSGSYLQLKFRDCNRVVSCSSEMHSFAKEPDVKYLKMDPNNEEDNHLVDVYNFIESELEKKHNVVVQCENGLNKSAATMVYYVMRKKSLSLADSYRLINKLRTIKISPSLMQVLMQEEKKLYGSVSVALDGRKVLFLDEENAEGKPTTSKPSNPYTPLLILGGVGGFFAVLFGALYLATGKI
jgi:hypothetical protein